MSEGGGREIAKDRRHVTRSGRREGDPKPLCPFCGLAVKLPHGSDADCIAALKEEIAMHWVSGAGMTQAKTAKRDVNGEAGAVAERQLPDRPVFQRPQ